MCYVYGVLLISEDSTLTSLLQIQGSGSGSRKGDGKSCDVTPRCTYTTQTGALQKKRLRRGRWRT